jgi:hypothetical protein
MSGKAEKGVTEIVWQIPHNIKAFVDCEGTADLRKNWNLGKCHMATQNKLTTNILQKYDHYNTLFLSIIIILHTNYRKFSAKPLY